MSVEYPFFSFAAPPGTWSNHFLEAFRLAGLGKADKEDALRHFSKVNNGKILRVSSIRHPCWWLAGVYSALSKQNSRTNADIHFIGTSFVGLDKSSFDAFIQSYLQMYPTGVSCLFDQYKADTRLRVEDMPWCLLELLEAFEIPKVFLDSVEAYWRTKVYEVMPEWMPHLYQQVLEAEGDFCCEHDYY